jgi:hypothetical protein
MMGTDQFTRRRGLTLWTRTRSILSWSRYGNARKREVKWIRP